MIKKWIACLLALSLLLPLLPAAAEAPGGTIDTARIYHSPDTVYTVWANGGIRPGEGRPLPLPLNGALTGEEPLFPETAGTDEGAISAVGSMGDTGGMPAGVMTTDTGTVTQLTMEDIRAMNPGSMVLDNYTNEGYLSLLLGKFYEGKVTGPEEGILAVQGVASLLGLGLGSEFFAVCTSRNSRGYTFYTYQQRYGRLTLRNSTLRVIVDPEGYTAGLSCSFAPNIGIAPREAVITADQAAEAVSEWYSGEDLTFYPERTVVLAATFRSQIYNCYVVYTDNPYATPSFDMPYLEHFVTTDGVYLTGIPANTFTRDNATVMDNSGYFEGLKTREYRTTVILEDGSRREIRVPVSYNPKDGLYYLMDPERRIAVADYYDFNYLDTVSFVNGETIGDWSGNNLLAYANYIVMYDFYADHGIRSVDGYGTPILITVGWCDENGEPEDNACYYGEIDGWACFGVSDINHLSDALDVVGHEYTHGVTRESMQGTFYQNETGAISEAYSDVMGNLAEMSLNYTEDRAWLLGEKTGEITRDMGRPNDYQQPAYVGDMYYLAPVLSPSSTLNDGGGVHYNSSLIGHIAYLMDQKTDMSYEEQFSMWLLAIEVLTPLSDYSDLHGALLFSLRMLGTMDKYGAALNQAFAETGLDDDWNRSYLTAVREGCGRVTFEADEALAGLTGIVYFMTEGGKTVGAATVDADGVISALLPAGTYVARYTVETGYGGGAVFGYTRNGWYSEGSLRPFEVRAGEVTALTYPDGDATEEEYGDIELVPYDGGFFSMKVPRGWKVETGGRYTSFCYKVYDPADPSTQVFFYGNLVPFHKSEADRDYWAERNQLAGLAPVLTSPNVIGVLNCWNYTVSFMGLAGFEPAYTELDNMALLGGSYFSSGLYTGLADSESVCVITCGTEWDEDCLLTLAATLVDYDQERTYKGHMFYNLINLCGIMAPAGRYGRAFDSLRECVESLTFTEEYLREARANLEFMADNAARTSYLRYLSGVMRDCCDTYGQPD